MTQPLIALDSVVLDSDGRVLVIRRKNPPYQGQYALPGGFMEYGETVEQGAARELKEETGLVAVSQQLIGVYSNPDRDPRGHVVSIAFLTKVSHFDARAADDAMTAEFIGPEQIDQFAFDHRTILLDALFLRPE